MYLGIKVLINKTLKNFGLDLKKYCLFIKIRITILSLQFNDFARI